MNPVGNTLSRSANLALTNSRSISQGRAVTVVTNLLPAGQRISAVGSITASDGTVWTVPAATQFATAPKASDLFNEVTGVTPTNIAGVNLNAVPIVEIDPDGEVITGYLFADNYFELYVNGTLVAVDPVPFTPFNSSVVKFRAKRPITYAVKLVDWEENLGLGTELNGGNPNHPGDGGFMASFSDGTFTGPNWKAQSFYIAPLDNPNLVVEMPDGTHNSSAASTTPTLGTNCYALHYPVPGGWQTKSFNHSNWPSAATYTEAAIGVNNKPAYLNFPGQLSNSGAQFIWSSNLILDNEVIVRYTGPAATNTSPVFTGVTTNRYIVNSGAAISITNTATDGDVPSQTLTYDLLNAPGGATINTNTGAVNWITTTNNAGTSNYFRVVVTDNGTPALRATNDFTVFVRSQKPNVVIIVTDDHGWGDVSSHGGLPATPNMDRLGSEGIRLERFYATPVCSVTRSALLTGRSPNRTSVGNTHGLDLREHIMPQTFKAAGYQTFMCGKWHLGGLYNTVTNTLINGVSYPVIRENVDYQPQNRGWDVHYGEYSGAIGYQSHISQDNGQHDWWLNGQTNLDAGWSTDLLADKAVQLLQQRDPSKPVMIYLAFNAVHGPVSAPTNYLNKYTAVASGNRRLTLAAIDQMDVAIGRVLDAIDAEGISTNTLVTFFGDNGGQAASGGSNLPLRGDKGDLFDGGIHTPAAARWPGVLPAGVTNCQQFMWAGDWFPTLCAATGVTPLNTKPFDGFNMWPILLNATNGAFNPANQRGVPLVSGSSAGSGIFGVFSNGTNLTMFKLIRDKLSGNNFTNSLFDIINDPYETNDIVNLPAYSNVVATLVNHYSTLTPEKYSPYIGVPPQSASVPVGSNVTLWAITTAYAKPVSTQWRKNGVNLVGATNYTIVDTDVYLPILNLTNVSTADAATYDLVVTDNAIGWPTSAISLPAALTVTTGGPSNTPPTLLPQIDRTVNPGYTLMVTNVAFDSDSPAQSLTFNLVNPPANASINATNGVITFNPTFAQFETTNNLMVVVNDSGVPALSATNSFKVFVIANTAPILLPLSNRTIAPGDTLVSTNFATDAESPPQLLTYFLAAAPVGASINATNGLLTWSTTNTNAGTTNSFTVIVSDNGVPSLIAARSFNVVVGSPSTTVAFDLLLGRPTDTSMAVSVLASNDLQIYFEYGTSPGVYNGQTITNAITNAVPRHITIGGLSPNQRYYYRMRYSTTGGAPFSSSPERNFVTQRARGSTFSFLIEADPHNRDNVPAVWKLALTNMLADNADFLLDLGDTFFEEKVAVTNAYYLTRPGIFELHQEVRNGFFGLAGHSLPTFLVSGNHDPELGWLATSTNSPAVWGVQARQHFFPVPSPGGFYTGATNVDPYTVSARDAYYAFEWGDALFVTLDPYWYSTPKPNTDGWSWTLGTNQYYWLKRTLETSTAKFKFVFAHHLIGGGGGGEARGGLTYHNFFEWGGYATNGAYEFPTKRPGLPAPIKDLLLTNNVQVFFHGHDHLYVKEDFFAPGSTSAVPTFIYQEVPQPSQTIYGTNAATGYGYTNANSVVLPSSGHLRVTVSPTNTLVEYVRVFLPANEGVGKTNRMISHSYNIPAPVSSVTPGWSMLKLPDTGQTTSYTTVPGEDADYLINPPSYTDNGNGTITDNVTGLMWQKADGGEMTLSDAQNYAQNTLNTTNFGGYNDWRMPTIHELMSILRHDRANPALNTSYFTSPGVSGGTWNTVYWWSKDQRVGNSNQWCANAGGGIGPKPLTETISAGGTLNYRIRCVRGAASPAYPRSRFINNGNGTVTDTDTGLVWQQGELVSALDWTNALNYTAGLVLGGFQDWRLPNIKELESLNDEMRSNPSIDTNFFPNARSARYWSSTTQFGHATNAWWNEFINGITSYEGTKAASYWVRAVRGGLQYSPPSLSSASLQPNGDGYTFSITGEMGHNYIIQASTNLTTWVDVFGTNLPAMPFQWTDTNKTFSTRFYRVRLE